MRRSSNFSKERIQGDIKAINRINGRIMGNILKTDKTLQNIYVENSYATHSGYIIDKIEEYGAGVYISILK